MNKRCCPDHRPSYFPNPLRSTESEARETFSYNTGADKQIKTFQGTLEDFKKVVDSIDNGGILFIINPIVYFFNNRI